VEFSVQLEAGRADGTAHLGHEGQQRRRCIEWQVCKQSKGDRPGSLLGTLLGSCKGLQELQGMTACRAAQASQPGPCLCPRRPSHAGGVGWRESPAAGD
jgi:hypothetical protein